MGHFRMPPGMSKAKRKEWREKERRRLEELEQLE